MRNSLLHRLSAAALIVLLVNSRAAAEPRVLISSATDGGATWRDATDKPGNPPPKVWQHDVFHADGKPYDAQEFDLLRQYRKDFPSEERKP